MRVRHRLREGWAVKELDTGRPNVVTLTRAAIEPDGTWLAATMPAQVHDVLLAHDLIPDPRLSRNAAQSAWVGERDWAYACTFPSPAGEGPVYLRFEGLDTLATAYLNGQEIGRFDNMHRHHVLEVRPALQPPGERNVLLILFASALRAIEQVPERYGLQEGVVPYHYVR